MLLVTNGNCDMHTKRKVIFLFWLTFLASCGSDGGGNGGNRVGKGSDSMNLAPQAAQLMFTPQEEGVVIEIQNPTDFEDMTAFIIFTTDQMGNQVRHQDVTLADFFNNGYSLTGLVDGESYSFVFLAIYSEGRVLLVPIDFVWSDNDMDHSNGGIAIGKNTDGDALADMVDNDDDGDGIMDPEDNCQFVFNPDQRNTDSMADGGDLCDPDDDNDNVADEEDMDYDGDGLIEIDSAEELDRIRFVLNGSGWKPSAEDELNRTGCDACQGYELTSDIDLTAYIDNSYGMKGWLPLGNDPMSNSCQEEGFSAIFEGNNFTISGLRIMRPNMDCVGLFGKLSGTIRHLNLVAAEIEGRDTVGGLAGLAYPAEVLLSSATIAYLTGNHELGGLIGGGGLVRMLSSSARVGSINGYDEVGGLIGNGELVRIVSSSANVGSINGYDEVGGLIGNGYLVRIVSSSARVGSINGYSEMGGLAGYAREGEILSSFATFDLLRGEESCLGGLVGNGPSVSINGSYALFDLLSGQEDVGGLVGDGQSARIHSSYVRSDLITGYSYVGGLVGDGDSARIHSSYVRSDLITGYDYVGGLIGDGRDSIVNASYSHINVIRGQEEIGGLIGDGSDSIINASYSHINVMRGEEEIGGLIGYGRGSIINDSYAIVRLIEGEEDIGGLIGRGNSAQITSSAAIANLLNSFDYTGGLIGDGSSARILSSYAIVGSLNGEIVGGLMGEGDSSSIISSYAVVAMLEGQDTLGALIGEGDLATITSSYVVSSLRTYDGYNLVGEGEEVEESSSYWDSDIAGLMIGDSGRPHTSVELKQPTDYDGIYANWATNDNNITLNLVWCDEDLSGSIEEEEKRDDNRIWDFGSTDDYPAIRCGLLSVEEQRSWWSVNGLNGLQLNQTRFDELLP